MKVFVIPEDFTKDQHMLKPIIEGMMGALDQPANVRVCQNPRLGGVSEALKWSRISEILDQRSYVIDLFLLCIDRDGEEHRRQRLERLEEEARTFLPADVGFLASQAHQEIEVWVLAGCSDFASQPNIDWQAVREERDPKEWYFKPYAEQCGASDQFSDGRKKLGKEAGSNYATRVRQLCEEVEELESRVESWLGERA